MFSVSDSSTFWRCFNDIVTVLFIRSVTA